ncbi:RecX family transcriptional regulator, partial [Candidatus Roizmanbacteria bacterium]|nr:RecX family transcriptional regulator [Candidatus Roizmanbacteria bacterium]
YLKKRTKDWNDSTSLIDETIKHLEEIGLIDESKFIDWLVHSRTSVKSKGERAIRIELQKFGVESDLIDQYFSQNPVDDEALALRLLSKSWRRFSNLPEKIRFQKAINFLLRRGYSFSRAKEAYNQVKENEQ